MTGPVCSRCGKPEVRSRGLCNACYTIAYRRGDFTRPQVGPDAGPAGKCSHPGCPDPAHSRGLCRRHAWQAARYGQVIDLPHIWSPPGEWTALAACAADPDLMFADDYRSVQAARRICAGCPVRAECLACALDRAEPFGVWGGLTTEERAAVSAGKRAVA